ncbi:MAG: hypothetical protein AAF492_22065, partial [Verrucomicrobiota bacterium]
MLGGLSIWPAAAENKTSDEFAEAVAEAVARALERAFETPEEPSPSVVEPVVEAPPPEEIRAELDLSSCQAIAREKNRSLQVARNNLTSAHAGERIAEAEVFAPTLDVSGTVTEDNDVGEARAELNFLTPLGIEVSPFI